MDRSKFELVAEPATEANDIVGRCLKDVEKVAVSSICGNPIVAIPTALYQHTCLLQSRLQRSTRRYWLLTPYLTPNLQSELAIEEFRVIELSL